MNLSLNIRKKVTFLCSLTECLIFGGPTFGWASLVYVLRDRGYFSDLCANATSTQLSDSVINGNASDDYLESRRYPTCAEQDAFLQLVFIVGAFGINSSSLLFGPLYDKYGSRLTRVMSSIFIMTACLLFAFSSHSTAYLTFIALHLLASGGILLLITSFQVGNLFGSYRSTVMTIHSGAFGSSAIVMLFVKIAYTEGVSMMSCFIFLAGISLIFNVNTFILLPKYKIPWPLPENWGKSVTVSERLPIEDTQEMELVQSNSAVTNNGTVQTVSWMDVEYPSLLSCLKSLMFLLFLMWFSILQLTHFFYIGTFNPRLQFLTDDDKDTRPDKRTSLDDLQDFILGILLANFVTAAFNVTMMIPVLPLQFLTFFLQVMGRAFIYGCLATFISTTFPGRYFGSVYGTISILAACIALFQYPLLKLVQGPFDNNSFYVDLFLLILNVCTLTQPLYVYYFVSKKKRFTLTTEYQPTFADSASEADLNEN
ncbi:solute carrier family 43 member 3-like isoform X2 [Anneissia japonica]|uniref:solute carrier family 43 member 3-like isoform X2 n=1 Tax=Anneissia japonica TaxID=1529436 RepID=UPI0014255669|nr:solute carrier family 43 member 3-like isoform X2 [Anneissia japonica]